MRDQATVVTFERVVPGRLRFSIAHSTYEVWDAAKEPGDGATLAVLGDDGGVGRFDDVGHLGSVVVVLGAIIGAAGKGGGGCRSE